MKNVSLTDIPSVAANPKVRQNGIEGDDLIPRCDDGPLNWGKKKKVAHYFQALYKRIQRLEFTEETKRKKVKNN